MADNTKIINALNTILELELAGVVRYTHYGLMVYGYSRIPIISWPGDRFKFLKHLLEWDYFLGVISFYLLTFLMWKNKK